VPVYKDRPVTAIANALNSYKYYYGIYKDSFINYQDKKIDWNDGGFVSFI